jgi:hypothetical protein
MSQAFGDRARAAPLEAAQLQLLNVYLHGAGLLVQGWIAPRKHSSKGRTGLPGQRIDLRTPAPEL